jgi:hypothetical protein
MGFVRAANAPVMTQAGEAPAALHRVVEKCLANGRRQFEYSMGLWRPSLSDARLDAQRLVATTLAHRLFICQCGGPGPLGRVVEELELPPLLDRMRASDAAVRHILAARHPAGRLRAP